MLILCSVYYNTLRIAKLPVLLKMCPSKVSYRRTEYCWHVVCITGRTWQRTVLPSSLIKVNWCEHMKRPPLISCW